MLRDYARPDEPDKIKDYILDKINTGDLIPVAYNKDKEKIYIYEPFDSELWEYEFKPKEWGWDRRFWPTAKCKLPNVHYTDPLRASMVPWDLSYFLLRWVERPSSTAGSVALTVMSRTTSDQYITVDNIGLTDIFTEQELLSQDKPITNLEEHNGKIKIIGPIGKQSPLGIDDTNLEQFNKSLGRLKKMTNMETGFYFMRPNGELVFQSPIPNPDIEGITLVPGTYAINKLAFNYGGAKKTSIKTVVLPASVREIGAGAFFQYHSLVNIDLNTGLEYIGWDAFYDCNNMASITLPSSLRTIEERAFGKCVGLKSLVIPNGITEIPKNCFRRCTSLESIVLPESLTTIGQGAFSHCEKLTSINIPQSLTHVAPDAFFKCGSIPHLNYKHGGDGIELA